MHRHWELVVDWGLDLDLRGDEELSPKELEDLVRWILLVRHHPVVLNP